jgi:hypothetical protein
MSDEMTPKQEAIFGALVFGPLFVLVASDLGLVGAVGVFVGTAAIVALIFGARWAVAKWVKP